MRSPTSGAPWFPRHRDRVDQIVKIPCLEGLVRRFLPSIEINRSVSCVCYLESVNSVSFLELGSLGRD